MKLSGIIFLALSGCYVLMAMFPRWRLSLDPWLSDHQKRKLREVMGRTPMQHNEFVARMEPKATDERVVSKVRQRVAEGVAFLAGHSIDAALIYPQDRIVADLGIGSGPDLDDTAIIMAVEKDLGISLPGRETEKGLHGSSPGSSLRAASRTCSALLEYGSNVTSSIESRQP